MNLTYSTTITINGEERDIDVLVDITNVVVVPPDSTSRASPDDYYGYKEMEFDIESVTLYDEDGKVVQVIVDKTEIDNLGLDYDKIEAFAWEELEKMRDNE